MGSRCGGIAWVSFSFACVYPVRHNRSCFLETSAKNRTRCVYLHGCVVMITRFPQAGQRPISVLQKWCRENLAQSGSQATADWTSCTLHKWESLILHVGKIFHMQHISPLFLREKTIAWPDPTQSSPLLIPPLSSLSLLCLLFCLCLLSLS